MTMIQIHINLTTNSQPTHKLTSKFICENCEKFVRTYFIDIQLNKYFLTISQDFDTYKSILLN
jgi:hypothetical protein